MYLTSVFLSQLVSKSNRSETEFLKAYRQDEYLPVQFWIPWAFVQGVRLCINGLKADFFLVKATEDTLNVSWMNKLKKNREVKNGGFPGEP